MRQQEYCGEAGDTKKMLKNILKYKLVSIMSLISIAFVVGGFLWAYIALGGAGSGPFILHFNDMEGITSVGGLGTIVFMGAFGLIVTVMNALIALEFEGRNAFLGKLVAVLTLLLAILLFMAFASILSVN